MGTPTSVSLAPAPLPQVLPDPLAIVQVGKISDASIQKAIDDVLVGVEPGHGRADVEFVFGDGVYLAACQRLGSHFDVEAALKYTTGGPDVGDFEGIARLRGSW